MGALHILFTFFLPMKTIIALVDFSDITPRVIDQAVLHGRTFGALSVTSDEHYRAPFGPLLSGVRFVPVNEPEALLAAVSPSTAAIIALADQPLVGTAQLRKLIDDPRRSADRIVAAQHGETLGPPCLGCNLSYALEQIHILRVLAELKVSDQRSKRRPAERSEFFLVDLFE